MAARKRFLALALAAVSLALTVTGVLLAALDPNPGGIAKDPLVLNGYPPTSADLALTLTTNTNLSVNANLSINFRTNEADAVVHFPDVVAGASVELKFAQAHLFARSADESSGPWLSSSFSTPNFFGLSLELTKPDIYLISGFHKTVSSSGYSKTYVFTRRHVALSSIMGSSKSLSILGSVSWSITVGSQGEVSQSTLVVTSKKGVSTLTMMVQSYNKPVHVSVPSSSDTKPISASAFQALLKRADFKSVLIPRDFTSLSRASLS